MEEVCVHIHAGMCAVGGGKRVRWVYTESFLICCEFIASVSVIDDTKFQGPRYTSELQCIHPLFITDL